jgi:hypothetical protein
VVALESLPGLAAAARERLGEGVTVEAGPLETGAPEPKALPERTHRVALAGRPCPWTQARRPPSASWSSF